ncbi:MAG: glycosyltransferase [Candidatus Portnoybacteria bacterium]|nr:glycosyltransferase [Candidatus Portnoybacteria bacterium]MDD4982416.1 glycosyltransferase [Candidatus Portnoybacteria bacterium]
MKVALVHDYLTRFGGAERVLLELAEMFPEAPIYTFLYDEAKMGGYFPVGRVRVSFLQKFPKWLRSRPKYLLPFLPVAPETFDLRDFDLVISSSSAFAKGVITRPKTVHINYCHNPARFLWDYSHEYLGQQKVGGLRQLFAKLAISYLRLWDRAAGQRVDAFIANSRATAGRIQKFYRQTAKVIYPPVYLPDTEFLLAKNETVEEGEEYFLIVSQLTPYKKVDVAIEAFNKLGLPLVIIGEGPQEEYLRSIAKENISILGWRSDKETAEYYKNCYAFVFPGEDDFGIAPVEAMGYGKPVLALNAGGAQETVLPSMTGELFNEATPEVLADGVRRLRENYKNYSPLVIRKWAEKFSEERFRREIMEFIEKVRYN